MRKVLWCCAGAGAVVSMGLMGLGQHLARHPDSAFSRCVVQVGQASAVAVQPMNVVGPVLKRAYHAVILEQVAGVKAPACAEECAPPEPRPAEDCAPPEQAPVPEHAAIIIPDDEPPAAAQPAEALLAPDDPGGPAGGEPPVAGVDHSCPLVMPYYGDEEPNPGPMPHVEVQEDNTGSLIIGIGANTNAVKGSAETSEPAGPEAQPGCQEDRHYHEHYTGCPYTGCPRPGMTSCPPGQEELSEELLPPPTPDKKRRHGKRGDKGLAHPEVDTMEYRPGTDGKLNEYGPGPF